MDNASKAIIMAGGILIAVAVISVALYMFANASELAKASDEILERSQIESFNRFYYAYAPLMDQSYTITGLDAYNVYNRATNNNIGKESGDYQFIQIIDGTGKSFTEAENFLADYTIVINADPTGLVNRITIGG